MQSEAENVKEIFLEQKKRVSESLLWNIQSGYYDQQGIYAWTGGIPFYITCNPFISKTYAQVIVRFISDCIQSNSDAKNHPFYVMELGTGSGKFSFYVIKDIHSMLERLGLSDIKICYVMSDCTMKNIDYYKSQEIFAPYIASGEIDFALYNINSLGPIHLLQRNKVLSKNDLVNPLIILANYMLDTIADDFFMVSDGKLYELLLSISTSETNVIDNRPADLEKIKIEYTTHEISPQNYYQDPAIESILDFYAKTLVDTSFSLPIGILRAFNHFRELSNNRLMFISTDKGYTQLASLENLRPPTMTFHGGGSTFSLMVNFHAIGEYFKNIKGDSFIPTLRKGIKSNAFVSGFKFSELPQTKLALDRNFEAFGPSDFFNLHRVMSDLVDRADLETMASHLHLSDYDTHIYQKMNKRIVELLPEADMEQIESFSVNMHKVAEHYYYMPKTECVLFEVAVFYHASKQYEHALEFYKQAMKYIDEDSALFYNMGLCLNKLDRHVEALAQFQYALKLQPDSNEAKDWVTYLEQVIAGNGPST